MAVIDQDNFSNISWHSEQNHPGASSHPHAGPLDGQDPDSPDVKPQQPEGAAPTNIQPLDAGMGGEVLECTVSDPLTENAGTKDAYVSYLITTHVRLLYTRSGNPKSWLKCLMLTIIAAVHLPILSKAQLLRPSPLHGLRLPFENTQQRLSSMRCPTSA